MELDTGFKEASSFKLRLIYVLVAHTHTQSFGACWDTLAWSTTWCAAAPSSTRLQHITAHPVKARGTHDATGRQKFSGSTLSLEQNLGRRQFETPEDADSFGCSWSYNKVKSSTPPPQVTQTSWPADLATILL